MAAPTWAATPAGWLAPVTGNWTDATRWSSSPNYPANGVPTAADTYDAIIDATTAAPYTVALNSSLTVDTLTLNSTAANLSIANGTLTVGDGMLLAGGAIGFDGANSTSVLKIASGSLSVANDAVIHSALQTGTVQGAILNAGSLLADVSFHELHLTGLITNNGTVRAANLGRLFATGVTNHGLVTADTQSSLTLDGTWTNAADGSIVANLFSTLNLNGTWTSAGPITSNGGIVVLSGNWSAPGGISVTNGTLNLGGTFSLPVPIQRFGNASINLVSTLINTPNSLALNATTGAWNLSTGGRIVGGTISTSGGATLVATGGTIDSANVLGEVDIGPGGILHLAGTWTNNGTIASTSGTLDIDSAGTNNTSIAATNGTVNLAAMAKGTGSISFKNCIVNITGSVTAQQLATPNYDLSTLQLNRGNIDATGTTLTISRTLPLQFKSGTLTGGSLTTAGGSSAVVPSTGSLVLFGTKLQTTLTVQHGGTLALSGPWQNNGVIALNNAALTLAGSFSTSQIGTITASSSSSVLISNGTLNNSGTTLTITSNPAWQLSNSTITGGTIAAADPSAQLSISNIATFSGVTLAANAAVQSSSGLRTLIINSGLTLANNSTVTLLSKTGGITTDIDFRNSSVTGNGAFVFGGTTNSVITGEGSLVTIGSGITIQTGARGGTVGGSEAPFLNTGLISARTTGQTITLNGTGFTNQGTVEAINGGIIAIAPSSSFQFINADNGNLNAAGGSVAVSATAQFLNQGSISATNGGTVTILGSEAAQQFINSSAHAVSAAAGSSITINRTLNWIQGAIGGEGPIIEASSATISGNVSKPGGGVFRVNGTFVLGAGLRFDLTTGKLLLRGNPAGTWNGAGYTNVTALIASGRGDSALPYWDGPGIITSEAQAISGNYNSIGVASASDVRHFGTGSTVVWSGQTVFSTDTLVMYTYGGDATLDGKLNIDDYMRIDNGIAAHMTGWSNGDFNYDGKVNVDDYTILDQNFKIQGPPIATADGGGEFVSAVPEPECLCAIALVGGSLVAGGRRRRALFSARRRD